MAASRAASADTLANLLPIRSLNEAAIAPGGTSSPIRDVPCASKNSLRMGRVVINAIAAPKGGKSYAVVGKPVETLVELLLVIDVNGDL